MTLIQTLTANPKLQEALQTAKTWAEFKAAIGMQTSNTALKKALTKMNMDYKHLVSGQPTLRSHVWSIPEPAFRQAVVEAKLWSQILSTLGFPDLKLLYVVKDRIRKLGMNVDHLKRAPRPDFESILTIPQETFAQVLTAKDPALKRPPETWRELCIVLKHPAAAKPVVKSMLDKYALNYDHLLAKKLPKPSEAFVMHSKVLRPVLIKLLLDQRERKCDKCNATTHQGEPIPVRLIYKNKDPRDAQVDNLSLVCANCKDVFFSHVTTPPTTNKN